MNPKSWIFCVIMRPLFDTYNKCVSTRSVDEFLNTLWHWLDQYCSLPTLRPVVLDTLTKLSINTAILDDPNCLGGMANWAMRNEDPTAMTSSSASSSSTAKDACPVASVAPSVYSSSSSSSSGFSASSDWNHRWSK